MSWDFTYLGGSLNFVGTYSSDFLELFWREVSENIALWRAEYLECYGTVMVLQWRHVIVPENDKSDQYSSFVIWLVNMSLSAHLTAKLVLAFIWYVLLYPGWSRSWQMQAVRRTQRSRLLKMSIKRQVWIKTYLRKASLLFWYDQLTSFVKHKSCGKSCEMDSCYSSPPLWGKTSWVWWDGCQGPPPGPAHNTCTPTEPASGQTIL